MTTAVVRPFEELAREYDTVFSKTPLGQRLRQAVWNHLDAAFPVGSRVLDLGCGTGEDAIHMAGRGVSVVALDREPGMLAEVDSKAREMSLFGRIQTIQADLSLPLPPVEAPFDGAYSNFGALNCVDDLPGLARGVARVLSPGAVFLACVMGPVVPWEWLWFLLRGRAGDAFRRLSSDPIEWRGLRIRYPAIPHLAELFSPWFRLDGVFAIGALLPPSYAREWVESRPSLLEFLDRWERRVESVPPFPQFADHFLARLIRV
jgi:SAM-dependent methyltransferase